MKKVLSVVLSLMMILTCMLPAFAAEKTYDVAKVANGEVADLNADAIADVLLDWIDRQIAKQAESFNNFEVEVMGQTVSADIEVNGLQDMLQYVDYLDNLGGDFANLTEGRDALKALDRANGGVNFIKGFIDFMAANADVLGKVFRWDENQFDLGAVGEFIDASDLDDVKDAYNYYKYDRTNSENKTFNIQDSFVSEIAREMGYTIPEGEGFDDVLNNGIKAKFLEIFDKVLSDDSKAAVNEMNLKTTDVYTLVKEFVGLLQDDYKDQLDNVLSSFLSALQGMIKVVSAGVNVEPPVVTIGDANGVIGTYHPGAKDPEDYMPKVYSPYKEQLAGTDAYDLIAGETLPEEYAALVAGKGTEMAEKFVLNAEPVPAELTEAGFTFPIEISFADVEAYVNSEIAEMLPDVQAQIDEAVAQAIAAGNQVAGMLGITLDGSVTINSATVALSYKGYATDDDFAMEVTATPTFDITYEGNVWDYAKYVGITKESIQSDYIQPAIDEVLTNPVATVVVTDLTGTIEELAQLQDLVSYIDADAEYDYDLLDVSANYDEYKGVVGQVNHILYGLVDMIASDAGMEYLGLTDGGNEYLDANLAKICEKVSSLLETMKKYIDRDTFVALADSADISAAFASEHGFNAGMIYDMDFSSVENALDCGIRVACDLLAEDDPDSIFYDFHMRVEDIDTLDGIAAAAADMIFGKVAEAMELDYTAIDYANVAEDGARDAIYNKIDDMVFTLADKILPAANNAANDLIAESGLEIGEVSFTLGVTKTGDWETDFAALVDRFIELTDGLCIPATNAKALNGLWAKASELIGILPIKDTMFSNYTDLATLDADFFDGALDGSFGSFLRYFEVKEDPIAGDVSVTKALINASDYIVDRFFPDTVQTELYPESETVQQEFTGNDSDQGIAARNMVSIKNRADALVPALLNLLRESGILPSLACSHETREAVAEVPATCSKAGSTAGEKCTVCGKTFGVEEIAKKAHSWGAWKVTKAATCVAQGVETRVCAVGGEKQTRKIAATGKHTYADGKCTVCGAKDPAANQGGDNGGNNGGTEQKTGFAAFWQRIVNFFNRIRDFFRNIFHR